MVASKLMNYSMSTVIEISVPLRELRPSSWSSLEFDLVSVWPRDVTVIFYVVFQFKVQAEPWTSRVTVCWQKVVRVAKCLGMDI